MAKGLAVPLTIGPTGRTVVLEGDEEASKIISLALGDNDNDNAFQQGIGLGQDIIYDPRNAAFRAQVLSRLVRIFATFDRLKLFRLDKTSIRWRVEKAGEQILEFKYMNLETDETNVFSKTFTRGSS